MTLQTSAPAASVPQDTAEVVAAAARTVAGVHALGRSVERASNAVRERVGLTRIVPGVKVELDRGGPARVAVSIVVDYPRKLREVSDAVREATRGALGGIGLDRADIDVRVTDVWGPFDTEPVADAPDPATPATGSTLSSDSDPVTPSAGSGLPDATPARDEAADVSHDPGHRHTASAPVDADGAPERDEVLAETLTDVAEAIAHAAEDVRSDRRAD